ncbi:hypothetical protein WISP_62759 [Willisornis vidua]|uniref:Reverse transcriptase domain-containing protein n=1 Tax=Willisornis vidua TaxID=1566151 RepID=A0ABQ9DFP6_9PASS|nr:hypothetical protein WISP_62759 [Willisornis vidua]
MIKTPYCMLMSSILKRIERSNLGAINLCAWEDHGANPLETLLRHMEDWELIQENQHSFSRAKYCLTNPVIFYNGVTTSVDKGRDTDVIYLNFCKAFDMLPNNIPVSKLEREGLDGCGTRWIRNWLGGCIQGVVING